MDRLQKHADVRAEKLDASRVADGLCSMSLGRANWVPDARWIS